MAAGDKPLGNASLTPNERAPRHFQTEGWGKWANRTKTSVGKAGPVNWSGKKPTSGRGNDAGRQRRRVIR